MNLSGKLIQGTGSYEVKELTTQDAVLKHLDVGTKFIECTSAGTVAFASDQAYGEWEFDIYCTLIANYYEFVFACENGIEQSGGYEILVNTTGAIQLNRRDIAVLTKSSADYIKSYTWYRIKITRTLDGEFYFYIKGGEYGIEDWTLVDASVTGTNPVINTSDITSRYIVLKVNATGDRLANIITRKAVKQ